MKLLIQSVVVCLFSINSFAGFLNSEGASEVIEKVSISKSASINIDGETIKLNSIGAGLRSKKMAFVNVRVYVAHLLGTSSETFKRTEAEALASIKDQKAIAMQLHFLRDVDGEKIQTSFKDALAVNNISVEDAALKGLLDSVSKSGEVKEGKVLTFVGTHNKDGSETIYFENAAGKVSSFKGTTGLLEKVYSMWLGKPADEGVANLKRSILNK
jgi:hypothetical protein